MEVHLQSIWCEAFRHDGQSPCVTPGGRGQQPAAPQQNVAFWGPHSDSK